MNRFVVPTSDRASAFGIGLLRISFGFMWIAHALLKWIVFTLPGTAEYFESLGFAGQLAYLVFALELVGGFLLVGGIYARHISLLLLPVMLVATWVHLPNGWVHTSEGGGWEYPLFLSVVAVVIALTGGGDLTLRPSRSQRADQPVHGSV